MSDLRTPAARLDLIEQRLDSLEEAVGQLAGHLATAISESAALSVALMILGTALEDVTKTLRPGTMGLVYRATMDTLDEETKEQAARVLGNLSHWQK